MPYSIAGEPANLVTQDPWLNPDQVEPTSGPCCSTEGVLLRTTYTRALEWRELDC